MTPLAIFGAGQIIAFGSFWIASGGDPSRYHTRWDGAYYSRIATQGYPTPPSGTGGDAVDGIWAFYPLYPTLVRALTSLTPLGTAAAGTLLSLASAAAAMIVLSRMSGALGGGRTSALATVALVSTAMAAPVLQMVYSDGLALLLLVGAFNLLMRRRYGLLLPVLVLLSLTRPLLLPFVAITGVHAVSVGRAGAPWPLRARAWGTCVASILLVGLWPFIAAIGSRSPTAYLSAMATFNVPGRPRSWFVFAVEGGAPGVSCLVAILVLLLWIALRALPVGSPVELRTWTVVYPAYLLLATFPSGSIMRYLLLAFPMPLVALVRGARTPTAWLVVLSVVGSALGVVWVFCFVGSDASFFIP